MLSKLALRPDLEECQLEDRTLLYAGPGLYASQFIPSSGSTPSFVVSGFSLGGSPGGGGSVSPGPQFFYLQIGLASLANGGVRLGGTFSVFNPPQALPTLQGPTIGSVPGSGGAGGISNASGYGGAISSGYNTSLSSSNNFGMGGTPVGSVVAHISGTTDQLVEAQANNDASSSASSARQDSTTTPMPTPSQSAGQSLLSPLDRLLGKGLGGPGGLLIGPGMSAPSGSSRP
jgi:hypothetical protein